MFKSWESFEKKSWQVICVVKRDMILISRISKTNSVLQTWFRLSLFKYCLIVWKKIWVWFSELFKNCDLKTAGANTSSFPEVNDLMNVTTELGDLSKLKAMKPDIKKLIKVVDHKLVKKRSYDFDQKKRRQWSKETDWKY